MDTLADAQPVAVQQQIELEPAYAEREEIVASPLIVRHLTDKATLFGSSSCDQASLHRP